MTIDNLEKFYRERGFSRVMSPHGFRASFATLANKHHPNWFLPIELCLGHQVNTSVQKLYNRATEDWLIKERREIYKWWGEKLEKCIKDTHARREKEAKITEKSKPS